MNNDLRRTIVTMITQAGEGHIPSAFSIVDIVENVYSLMGPNDHFVLSKGHGCAALYAVLARRGVISQADLEAYGTYGGILGGHPDRTKVPGVEASTGSLGHGLPIAAGMALGYKIQGKPDKVICLVGDGECHEGTVWETALIAQNLKLTNLCVIVDFNGSAAQIMPHPNIFRQWQRFGWCVGRADDGHSNEICNDLKWFLSDERQPWNSLPLCIIANTIKGKGSVLIEGHGPWHHKIPNKTEYQQIMGELDEPGH